MQQPLSLLFFVGRIPGSISLEQACLFILLFTLAGVKKEICDKNLYINLPDFFSQKNLEFTFCYLDPEAYFFCYISTLINYENAF